MAQPKKPPMGRLKVFRTSIGFHDAYVAAPSRKAALEAWGASKDLFSIGSAELVSDPALSKEPLAKPGTVIRRLRGSHAEHLEAAGEGRLREGRTAEGGPAPRRPARQRKPRPPPSRKAVDAADAALSAFETGAARQLADIRIREEALERERAALERRHATAAAKLERKVAAARSRYEHALDAWRRSND